MRLVSYQELFDLFLEILIDKGFEKDSAFQCAEIFTQNSLVESSHGINRFPSFIDLVKSGHVNPNAKPHLVAEFNSIQQWDGNLGPGPVNSMYVTKKTIELAKKFGMGSIALKNTNHWMRPGYYAWKAADEGFIFICWTNSIPIMPPWGGTECTTGNNPIVFGVPRKGGNIVLDMALSQYSYGALTKYRLAGKELPFVGGYDSDGKLTKNPAEISKTQRSLPIGYWKGSGLSLLLDLISTILSGGKSTFELSETDIDSGMSQIYIAIDPERFSAKEIIDKTVNEIIDYYRSSEKIGSDDISYPGERITANSKKNKQRGIPVEEVIWEKVINLRRNE